MVRILAIPVLLLLLGFGIMGLVRYLRRMDYVEKAKERGWSVNGDFTHAQEQIILAQLDQAKEIFASLISPVDRDSWEDATLLSARHRTGITHWLDSYDQAATQLQPRKR
jgi:hypothetical protein